MTGCRIGLMNVIILLKHVENSHDFRIYDQERFLMYAHFQDPKYRILDYVNHFDSQRRKVKRDFL